MVSADAVERALIIGSTLTVSAAGVIQAAALPALGTSDLIGVALGPLQFIGGERGLPVAESVAFAGASLRAFEALCLFLQQSSY